MLETRLRKWSRRLGAAALAVAALAIIGWRIVIFEVERAPTRSLANVPVCTGILDSDFASRAGDARADLIAMLGEREIPGLAVAVGVGGRLVWSEGIGFADRERSIPACANTQFRIQSVSKVVTTAVMARLVERGTLDLDAPVRTWVPDLPPALGAVTPRQLASHRAGVRDYRDDMEAVTTTRYETAEASLDRFRNDPLLFPPDSGSSYSSYGFVLLSAAMERASGLDFPTLLSREVFQPLGMARSEAERGGTSIVGRAAFYDNVTPYSLDGRVHPSPEIDFSGKWAGGGILSTAEDLVAFANAHIKPFNTGYLSDSTVDLIFTPRTRLIGPLGMGLGWMLGIDPRARPVRLHFGAGSGATSVLAIYPDHQVSVAVVANLGHAKFPMERLLGVVNAFVGDRVGPVAWIITGALLCAAVVTLRKRRTSGSLTTGCSGRSASPPAAEPER